MLKIIPVVLLLPGISYAASMTNSIAGVGPGGSVKPYICIQNEGGTVTLPSLQDNPGMPMQHPAINTMRALHSVLGVAQAITPISAT